MKVAAFAETPEEALVEMAMATHPATVEKHLPESVREALRQLTPSERSAAERQFMLAPSMLTRDGELIVPEDGHALLVMQAKDTAQAYDIRVEREINNGSDAMIELARLIVGAVQCGKLALAAEPGVRNRSLQHPDRLAIDRSRHRKGYRSLPPWAMENRPRLQATELRRPAM